MPGHAGVYTIQVIVPVTTLLGRLRTVEIQVATPDGKLINSNDVPITVESVTE